VGYRKSGASAIVCLAGLLKMLAGGAIFYLGSGTWGVTRVSIPERVMIKTASKDRWGILDYQAFASSPRDFHSHPNERRIGPS